MRKNSLYALIFALGVVYLLMPRIVLAQGCMKATSDEGVSVVGYLQTQFEYLHGELRDENTFTFDRARVGFIGNIPYDVSYYLFFELSPSKADAPYLLDCFITYSRLAPYLKISIGQFKSPFSLELDTSCAGLHTINRSEVVTQLAAPGRDQGLMFMGEYKILKYSFALMNGTGITKEKKATDEDREKDMVGRIVLSPTKFLSVGGSYRYGESGPEMEEAERDVHTRYGGELEIKFADFLFQGEYIWGKDIGSSPIYGGCGDQIGTKQGSYYKKGGYVQAMYMTPWNIQPVIKYEFWDPDTATENDQEQIVTYGINYFLNDWTRIQLNYLYCAEEVEIINDQVLLQFQIKF